MSPFAKMYLGMTQIIQPPDVQYLQQEVPAPLDPRAKVAEYDGARKTFSRLKTYVLQNGPLNMELENGRIIQNTAAASDQAVEDAFWITAYICKQFGGELLWCRDSESNSRNRIQIRAQHILQVLKAIKPESGGIETVMNVLHLWGRLEFLLFDTVRDTPLSESLLRAPWYWKHVLSQGPAEVLATVQHLKHDPRPSDFYLLTSVEIHRMGCSRAKWIPEEFDFFVHGDILFLVVNHAADLRPRVRATNMRSARETG